MKVDQFIAEHGSTTFEKALEIKACELREYMTNALVHAGSGHTGGSSSVLDILVALYHGGIARHDPENPEWEGRDRVVIAGHKAPALAVVLADLGYFGENGLEEYATTYRDFGSQFQGHLSNTWLKGAEISTGSLGQTISAAAGMAHALKVDGKDSKVYVIVGDGEMQEGQCWEGIMSAEHYNLDNLCLIVDRNGLQIDGPTEKVMYLGPIEEKLAQFGFYTEYETVHDSDGDILYDYLLEKFNEFKRKDPDGIPTGLVFETIKAFGFGDMENTVGSHGVVPSKETAEEAIAGFRETKEKLLEEIGEDVYNSIDWAPSKGDTPVIEIPKLEHVTIDLTAPEFDAFTGAKMIGGTRKAYGAVLNYLVNNNLVDLFAVDADLAGSTTANVLDKIEGFNSKRHINVGIAEQNGAGWAAGLASVKKSDKKRAVFYASFAVFVPGRCVDQIRNTVAYSGLDVNFVGTHAGLATGADGATHQALEDIAIMRTIPGMRVYSPSDAVSAVKAFEAAINYEGPTYIRLTREKCPVIYDRANAPDIHKANLFIGEGEAAATILSTGPIITEVLKAQKLLNQRNIGVDVYDFNCLKPIDGEALLTAERFSPIITVEDHNTTNGFGAAVAEKVYVPLGHRIGVRDKFGETGTQDQLYNKHGMTAEHIAKRTEFVLGK